MDPEMDPPAMMEMMEEDKPESEKKEEEPPAEEPKEEEPPKDEETSPMMEKAAAAGAAAGEALGLNAFGGGKDDGSDATKFREPVRTDCCCCLCGCSNENTDGVRCCFCIPIRAGIVVVGMIIFVIAFFQFMNSYSQFANATVPWWKPAVTLFLFSPGFIGACFFIGWYTKDCTRTRATLTPAVIQGLTSYVLILIWQIVYFFAIEKKDLVGSGMGDDLKTYTW